MSRYEEIMNRTEWFREARFGMFIHWGLYAIPARGEWIRSVERISKEEYNNYFHEFDPKNYNPKEWAKLAKKAGMKYAIMTAKHHDGFCLFDSKYTEFKSTNTKVRKDLIKEYIEAFREEGIKVGLYYSLIDWYHEDYPHYGDRQHPMRDNQDYKDKEHNFPEYIKYMHNQIRELLSNYGKIDVMWFDFSYDDMVGETWEASKIIEMCRELQPNMIIDNRMGSAGNNMMSGNIREEEPSIFSGDFASPEQIIPIEPICNKVGKPIPWEACVTMNNHWGYCQKDKDFKSPQLIIKTLVNCVSKGGNLLLNIGPNSKGEIPKESETILNSIGEWMDENSESIYGCGVSELEKPQWGRFTQNNDYLYAHVFEQQVGPIYFEGLQDRVEYARLLKDNSELVIATPWNAEEYEELSFITLSNDLFEKNDDVVIKFKLK